ncbi:SURF1 family protein [Rhodopseudomonas palustris]|uniref:SURF1 family protein n=1 Tax=Rhodopseudomonas palustris TaxID=1076 RepID=UPI001F2488CE|nr:SURF1 family protein [Rhodopseudomonas palustris]
MTEPGIASPGDAPARGNDPARRPSLWLTIPALLGVVLLIALGVWQIERRAWKLALIDRVDARIHAAPAPLPAEAAWPTLTAANDEYRRVTATGQFQLDRETLTTAVTEAGGGFWVITPLLLADGRTVLVNRGFIPPERRDRASRRAGEPDEPVTVTGLLRISEPRGGFLRHNDPAEDRWYSRDVQAIAAARGLGDAAPFFVDADASLNVAGQPIGGLTVVQFPNNHLTYALTWFCLAFMLAGWLVVGFAGEYLRGARARRQSGVGARSALSTGSNAGPIAEHR